MTPLASRVLVTVVGLPAVLALVYVGGWWLFVLVGVLPAYLTPAPE